MKAAKSQTIEEMMEIATEIPIEGSMLISHLQQGEMNKNNKNSNENGNNL